MDSVINAWQCIGCGNIEAPQTCIGVCEYRKVQFVHAAQYQALAEELEAARQRTNELAGLAWQLAHVTPNEGGFRATYLALQAKARALLAASKMDAAPVIPANDPDLAALAAGNHTH